MRFLQLTKAIKTCGSSRVEIQKDKEFFIPEDTEFLTVQLINTSD